MPDDFDPNLPEPPEESDEPDYDAESVSWRRSLYRNTAALLLYSHKEADGVGSDAPCARGLALKLFNRFLEDLWNYLGSATLTVG